MKKIALIFVERNLSLTELINCVLLQVYGRVDLNGVTVNTPVNNPHPQKPLRYT